jgi:hypothetical protein
LSKVRQQLTANGFGPVVEEAAGGGTRILVGSCERSVDAILLRQDLAAAGFAPERVFTQRLPEPASFTTELRAPKTHTVRPEPAKFVNSSAFYPDSRTDTSELFASLQLGVDDVATTKGLELRARLQDSDPAKGWLLKESAREIVKSGGKAAPVIGDLLAVAKGDVAASPEDRLEAQFMAADAIHYYYFKPLRAYRAYQEILESYPGDEAVKARCTVEIAACLLELARSEAGYYQEVRRYCVQLRHAVSPEFVKAHAVADLIYSEALMYEGLKQQALEELEGFADRHPGCTREISQANLTEGLLLAQMGEWAPAKRAFERNLWLDFTDPEQNFYWAGERWNMRKRSADYISFYANQFGDAAASAEIAEYLAAEHHLEEQPPADNRFDHAFPHTFYQKRATGGVK